MKSRNILFFISSLRVGGAQRHLLELCRYLTGRGIGVSVCSLKEGGAFRVGFEDLGVHVHDLPVDSLTDLARPSVRRSMRGILAETRPDILHAHLYHAEIAAAVAAAASGLPLVVTRHSSGLEFGGIRAVITSIAGRRIERVIAVSGDAATEALRIGARADSVRTIPNGVDTSRFRPVEADLRRSERERLMMEDFPSDCDPDCLLVGSMGNLIPVKNLPTLVESFAAAELPREAADDGSRLIVAGEGPSREELEKLVGDLGLGGRVSFPGYCDRPEEFLPLLDIFVLPSWSEGVPMALLEAMSCGLACVASRVGGMPGLLGDCGLFFEPGDVDGLTGLLRELAGDSSMRLELGRRARVRAMEHFDLEIWGDRTVDVYERLAGPPARH
jgi:glycosyltransferase involved in cell wall biosynthesis